MSVVIDNYNYAHYLDAAIQSALDQDYSDTEVVVVDDGSADGSVDVIRSYSSSVTAVLKSNGGQASAFNAGLAASSGSIVIFLDSDDTLLPEAAARAVSLLERGVSRVYWPMRVIDSEGQSTEAFTNDVLPEGDLSAEVLSGGPYMYKWSPTSGNAWARSFLEAVFPVPVSVFRNYVDNYLSALSPLFGEHRRAEPLGCWRRHGANETETALISADFVTRLESWLARFECCFESTAQHAGKLGLEFDGEQWKRNSWFHRLERAVARLLEHTPNGADLILIDEGRWQTAGQIAGRRTWPLMERDGVYWGLPASDAEAISDVRRRSGAGTEYMAFAWTSRWWLEHYAGLARWLQAHATQLCDERDLLLFRLDADRSQ